jgi:hypothetical protein
MKFRKRLDVKNSEQIGQNQKKPKSGGPNDFTPSSTAQSSLTKSLGLEAIRRLRPDRGVTE